ncbi:hypothetical protein MRX96_032693 [Rhipicephalus microplus]
MGAGDEAWYRTGAPDAARFQESAFATLPAVITVVDAPLEEASHDIYKNLSHFCESGDAPFHTWESAPPLPLSTGTTERPLNLNGGVSRITSAPPMHHSHGQ